VTKSWGVVVRIFPDGSAWVRVETGEDLPLTAAQVGPVELGEAGLVVLDRTAGGRVRDVSFERKRKGPGAPPSS
jgi:hypothetical protein